MLARDFRRLGSPGIDYDDLASAVDDTLEAARCVRHRHKASVRNDRVCTDNDQMPRAINISNRLGSWPRTPEHQAGRDDLRQVIDSCRIENSAPRQGTPQHICIKECEIMRHRVPCVDSDGAVSVSLSNLEQPSGHLAISLIPAHLLPSSGGSPDKAAQPAPGFVEVLHHACLRAYFALRQPNPLFSAKTD